jgi:hypothetical protein
MTREEITQWVATRTTERRKQQAQRAVERGIAKRARQEERTRVQWEARRVREAKREANPKTLRPCHARNEGWWHERQAGSTYTAIARREQRSITTVICAVNYIQRMKMWAWEHPTNETVVRGRTMLDDEDGR